MATKSNGLGKGLSALINRDSLSEISEGYIPSLPIGYIIPNRFQPRIEIKPESLVEIADSIREHGIIEPLLVTKKTDTSFELIAGERRWRAAKLAGLESVPVIVKESSPQEMLELAIIENIQRKDLNALEEALAFDQMQKTFQLSHEQVAKRIGMSRSVVANKIRLLSLPEEIKKSLLEDRISEGHARALLGLHNAETLISAYKITVRDNLSVRAVEELVRRLNSGKKVKLRKDMLIVDERTTLIENNLKYKFGERASIVRSARGGRITLPFLNDSELDKMLESLI